MFTSRGRAVWIIAALGLFAFAPPLASAADTNPCNGSDLLCNKTLDQVVLPGTHNSMSNSESGWVFPNQTYNMTHQLERGARAMLFDTHYGKEDGSGVNGVRNWKPADDGDPETEGAGTYFCHDNCVRGAVDLTEELGRIKDWLAANPREVLVFVNQDAISPASYETAVTDSGLLPYIYKGSVAEYPTLEQMIDSGQRVVMFAEQHSAGVPWYHNAYDGSVMETPYTFDSTEALPNGGLDDPAALNETCKPNRGSDPSPLFLMNHWVTTFVIPDIEKAMIVNTRPALVARAKACEARRGKLPNILAVDYFGAGDVVGAARELNGIPEPIVPPEPVPAEPFLKLSKPKAVKVKAKRKATFRVRIANAGDGEATAVKVCASVPRRLARTPRCVKVTSIAAGSKKVVKLRMRTKKRYRKGSGKVKFMVFSNDSDQSTLAASAKLKVKPLKKHKKHRRH
ncbi:MAG: hypothetical protein IPK93_11325 [Solirubrobacterales bacterium]|nr:hypothetical protein [Solirubrobacterales bacterium]